MLVTAGQPKFAARLAIGFTINLQNYESARIEASAEVEGTVDNKDAVWEFARKEVEQELDRHISELQQKDSKETMLGFKVR